MTKINQLRNSHIFRIVSFAALFLFVFVFLFRFTSYLFFYQEKASLFLLTGEYFSGMVNCPGGFLNWLSQLQTAFYYNPFAGAFIISAEICLVTFFLFLTGKILVRKSELIIPVFVGGLLFLLQTNYQFAAINILGILLQLFLFVLIIRFLKGEKIWFSIFLFPLWYFLTGSFSFVFFCLLLAYLFLYFKKGVLLKVLALILLTGIFIFAGSRWFFYLPIKQLLIFPYSNEITGSQQNLFLGVVALIILFPVVLKANLKIKHEKRFVMLLIDVLPMIVLLATALFSMNRIDKKNRHFFEVEKQFYQRNFEEVIRLNEKEPSMNMLTNYLNNIALAEKGVLCDQLFRFPQSPDGRTLFLPWELTGEVLRKGGYFYYSLGMTNEAARWAYEYMVMRGLTPEGLKLLIKTELINENYELAEKYNTILKASLFYQKEAAKFEKLLEKHDLIDNDQELGKVKRLKIKADFFVLAENPPANLDSILKSDPVNFVAVQYKFAWLLLQKDYKTITEMLPVLEKAGFTHIPKNIEEAVVAYCLLNQIPFPVLEKLAINPQTTQRFDRYYQIFQQNSANKTAAQRALREFKDTYWYYVFFN
jgi:hypothetical protein